MAWVASAATAYTAYNAYESGKRADAAAEGAAASAEVQNQIALRQQDMADEQYNYYKDTYQPLEQEIVAESRESMDPSLEIGQASSDVKTSYGQARDAELRGLTRMGVNPNSGRSLSRSNQYSMSQGAADATARNSARTSVADKSWSKKVAAAGLGKGLDSAASSTLAGASASAGNAASSQMGIANAYGQSSADMANFGLNLADKSGWLD